MFKVYLVYYLSYLVVKKIFIKPKLSKVLSELIGLRHFTLYIKLILSLNRYPLFANKIFDEFVAQLNSKKLEILEIFISSTCQEYEKYK